MTGFFVSQRELRWKSWGVLLGFVSLPWNMLLQVFLHPAGTLPWQHVMMSHYHEVDIICCLCLNVHERWREGVKERTSESVSKITLRRFYEIYSAAGSSYAVTLWNGNKWCLRPFFSRIDRRTGAVFPLSLDLVKSFISSLILKHLAKGFSRTVPLYSNPAPALLDCRLGYQHQMDYWNQPW